MASTTVTTLTHNVLAEFIAARILDEARPWNVVAPLVRNEVHPMGKGVTFNATALPSTTAASVTEASDIAATARTTTQASITIAEVGLSTDVTDLAKEVSNLGDQVNIWAASHGRAIGQKLTGDLCGQFASLNSSVAVGTSGTNITVANFIEAIFTLANNNAPGQKNCVLHPRQTADLMNAIQASTGTPWSNLQELIRGGTLPGGGGAGFIGSIFGVPIFDTTEVDNVNSDVDRCGAMFTREALLYVKLRPVTTELQRDASARVTEIVTTCSYGVGLGQGTSTYGVPVETDD